MRSTIPWPYARVSAHRGCGTTAPENTLEGFRNGLRFGYRAIETDAMLAKDKVPVIIHDEKLARTVLGDERTVPELTSLEFRSLDAGSWFGPAYCGVTPPSLEQIIRWCRANGVWMNIEIKPAMGAALETGRVVGELTAKLYADTIVKDGFKQENISHACPLFSSFERDALRGAMETAPDIPRGFLIDEIPDDWRDVLEEMQCVSLHTNWKRMTPEFVREVKDLGYWVFCWTPNDPVKILELFRWGVDAVCTDRLDLVPPSL